MCSGCSPNPSFQGYYTWGHEVRGFQACNSTQQYWVKSTPEIRKSLLDYYQANTTKPYESIYLEFRGAYLDEPREGFASEYDGLIMIHSVVQLGTPAPPDCKGP